MHIPLLQETEAAKQPCFRQGVEMQCDASPQRNADLCFALNLVCFWWAGLTESVGACARVYCVCCCSARLSTAETAGWGKAQVEDRRELSGYVCQNGSGRDDKRRHSIAVSTHSVSSRNGVKIRIFIFWIYLNFVFFVVKLFTGSYIEDIFLMLSND